MLVAFVYLISNNCRGYWK